MSEKMRAEFELWAKSEQISIEVFAEGEQNAGEYYFLEAHCAWKTWQASRAALVVELPTSLRHSECGYDYASEAFEETIDVVKLSLDAAGVTYK